ncbi:uroporphyrinogen decarboxylase family protein [Ruminococcus gauvreauii]|uniref:Uroporphyrinogen decarboxylase (URO-D) domain-containing protein n=1 Tax=Ruminococcus gauvreauii TaxID=438033 RepID=A0ABY5VLD3_9FIRM|nr:uroporphyrinogen decarboxylase family protein [Ruminococcus gauvreauii]UWP61404.1 hypothetical protein NQ502_10945 [Ruminococcus gauvreauii]
MLSLYFELSEFLDALTDWHIEFMKVAKKYYHADMILWHDDMGSQRAPFFSPELFREIYLPYYRRITKACHDEGMFIALHSCGNVGLHIENFAVLLTIIQHDCFKLQSEEMNACF